MMNITYMVSNSSEYAVVLNGLQRNSNYCVQVRAFTIQEEGPARECVFVSNGKILKLQNFRLLSLTPQEKRNEIYISYQRPEATQEKRNEIYISHQSPEATTRGIGTCNRINWISRLLK